MQNVLRLVLSPTECFHLHLVSLYMVVWLICIIDILPHKNHTYIGSEYINIGRNYLSENSARQLMIISGVKQLKSAWSKVISSQSLLMGLLTVQ